MSTTTEASETGSPRKVIALTELGEKELDWWLGEPAELPAGKSDLRVRMVATELMQTPGARQSTFRAMTSSGGTTRFGDRIASGPPP